MKKFIFAILFISVFLSRHSVVAQQTESKYQALFLYNFTKYMKWPEKERITIGVMGNSQVLIELQNISKRGGSKVTLVKLAGSADVDKCDLIFLPKAQTRNFSLIQENIGTRNIILVTEDSDLAAKGAEVGFYTENKKLKFIINKSEIEETKVIISQRLFTMAKVI